MNTPCQKCGGLLLPIHCADQLTGEQCDAEQCVNCSRIYYLELAHSPEPLCCEGMP